MVVTIIPLILGAQVAQEARGHVPAQPIDVVVLGDLAAIGAFSILLGVAISFRHHGSIHKRAMLGANIALVAPALGRISRFPVFSDIGGMLVPIATLGLLFAICVYDLVKDRRVHMVTSAVGALVFGGLVAGFMLANTAAGRAFVAAITF